MHNSEQAVIAHACHRYTLQLSGGLSVQDSMLVVTLLEVIEKEEGVVALHLPSGPLKRAFWVGTSTEMRTQYLPAH